MGCGKIEGRKNEKEKELIKGESWRGSVSFSPSTGKLLDQCLRL